MLCSFASSMNEGIRISYLNQWDSLPFLLFCCFIFENAAYCEVCGVIYFAISFCWLGMS